MIVYPERHFVFLVAQVAVSNVCDCVSNSLLSNVMNIRTCCLRDNSCSMWMYLDKCPFTFIRAKQQIVEKKMLYKKSIYTRTFQNSESDQRHVLINLCSFGSQS